MSYFESRLPAPVLHIVELYRAMRAYGQFEGVGVMADAREYLKNTCIQRTEIRIGDDVLVVGYEPEKQTKIGE